MKKLIFLLLIAAMMAALFAGCGAAPAGPEGVRIGVLTGPTALGMVPMLGEEDSEYAFTVCGTADELTPLLLQGELDMAAVPLNLAAVLYNKTEGGLALASVNVGSVLYVCQRGGAEVRSFADLRGRTICAAGKGSTPEYFLRHVLEQSGLDPDADVEILWKSEPAEVTALLGAGECELALLPQPYVTAAEIQMPELRTVLSVGEAWAAAEAPCATAGVVVRRAFLEEHPEAVDEFLTALAESTAYVTAHPAEAAGIAGDYGIVSAAVAEKAIPECDLVCRTGADMRAAAEDTLTVLFEANPQSVGGALPGEDFYYGA